MAERTTGQRRGHAQPIGRHGRGVESLERRVLLAADPIISEFMASNSNTLADQDGDFSDWIEIQNPNATPLDLGGYYLRDSGNQWQFPAGTTIAANGFLVVFASDKNRAIAGQQLHTSFKLAAEGEYLGLIKPDGATVVSEYAPFPAQQQDVSYGYAGGATSVPLVASGASAKAFVPPTSSFPANYTQVSFIDSGWTSGTTGVGFDTTGAYNSLIGLNLDASMRNVNASALIRVPFNASDVGSLTTMTLRMRYDDGYVAYLNGTEVSRKNVPTTPTATSAASSSHTASAFEDVNISNRLSLLNNGPNVLVIHGMNRLASNADFLILPELVATAPLSGTPVAGFLSVASPGASNTANSLNNGPLIENVTPLPVAPTDADNITITARVTPNGRPVSSVVLNYRVMFGSETPVTMFDDGAHGDGAAGDGVFGGTIPASASSIGQMVRWAVTSTDTDGRTSRAPFFIAGTESPQYFGTVIRDPSLTSTLPIIQVFAQDTANVTTRTGTRGAVFYNGTFYDNVFIRDRGGNTSDGIKIDFNRDDRFRWNPDSAEVDEINLNYRSAFDVTNLRAVLSFGAFGDAGEPALHAEPWRIQLNGAFWKQATFIENPDAEFLDRIGLDGDGSFYKAASDHPTMTSTATYEKKTRGDEDKSDLQAFFNGIHLSDPTARLRYILDNFDLMGFLNYWAVNTVVNDNDDVQKNFYLYRDTEGDGRWRFVAWDKDLTFGMHFGITAYQAQDPQTHPLFGDRNHPKRDGPNAYNYLIDQLLFVPEIKQMYLRRLRSVMDQFLQPASTPVGSRYFETRLDQYAALLSGDPDVLAYLGGATTFQTRINDIKTRYLDVRRNHLYVNHSTNTAFADFAGIPAAQAAGLSIQIGGFDVNPASGDQDQEYIRLDNPNALAVDISGWSLDEAIDYTLPGGTVIPAGGSVYVARDIAAFRLRTTGPAGNQGLYVIGGYDGQLSARGETIVLRDASGATIASETYAGSPTVSQQSLRVTEIMYHPADGGAGTLDDDFEFLELHNISGQAVSLTGVKFTQGFDLSLGGGSGLPTTLGAGEYGIIVRNRTAFESRYGTSINILGEFGPDVLDNGGERIRLEDAVGEVVLDFTFDDAWYPATDGGGASLVIVNPLASVGTWGNAGSWRASTLTGGSPGAPDLVASPAVVQSIVVNDGHAQRSSVRSITVTFDRAVVPEAGAFALAGRSGAGAGTIVSWSSPAANASGAATFWVIEFSGTPVIGGSLADGIYDLTILGSKIRSESPTGPAMAADHGFAFHRLYSDADGDGDSDNADLFQMRSAYGTFSGNAAYRWWWDYEGDGDVDNADVFQVRSRRSVVFQNY